jgi:hypothetical protein
MTDSKSPNQPDRTESDAEVVPEDLQALDASLSKAFQGFADQPSPHGLVDRVFEASVADLPTKVLPFEPEIQGWRLPYLGYAAMILVAVLAFVAVSQRGGDVQVDQTRIADASLEDFTLEGPRDSEAMLVAVLDPDEGWFEEDEFNVNLDLGVEAVLRSRMFGVDDLTGDVLAMLGGPAS